MAYTTIDDPSVYHQTEIYTDGDATTDDTTSQTFDGNSDLQPDWMWFKSRNVTGNHGHMDTSRGKTGGSFVILRNTTDAEQTPASGYDFTSMNSDGFSYGRANQLDVAHDTPANNTVWAWKANGGTTTTNDASSTGVGTIDSVYQANTTAGFSIVTYTGNGSSGASFAHGLGVAPQYVLIKNRDTARSWFVGHPSPGYNFIAGHLNSTDDKDEDSVYWNNTAPSSTVVTLGNNEGGNENGDKFVAYCFAPIQGYSHFASVEGNNNADGPFAYTGFKPAWVMLKNIDATGKVWQIWDSARDTSNVANHTLTGDATTTEHSDGSGASNHIDMLSNGFKIRNTGSHLNPDGQTLIYMAFAESPFVSSEGVPTTAK